MTEFSFVKMYNIPHILHICVVKTFRFLSSLAVVNDIAMSVGSQIHTKIMLLTIVGIHLEVSLLEIRF